MAREKLRLLLVDDHPLFSEGVRTRLAANPHFEIVAEATNGEEAVTSAENVQPDVVLMDISLPRLNGLEATRRILRSLPQTKIIVLTMHDDEDYVLRAVDAGAKGFLLKDSPPEELVKAIEAVERGEAYYSPPASLFLAERYVKEKQEQPKLSLSARESQVLTMLAKGYVNKEIAEELSLSVHTVATYRARIMRKLDLHTVAALTQYAIAERLIPSDENASLEIES